MSVYQLGIFVGSGLAYVIGGSVIGALEAGGARHVPLIGMVRPWQLTFLVVGLPGLLVAALFLTVREPPRRDAGGSREPATYAELFRHIGAHRKTFLTQSLGFAFSASVNFGIAAWLATFLIRKYGWTQAHAGAVQGGLTLTVGAAATFVGGWWSDWFVRRGKLDGPLRVGIIGAVGMLVSATAYPLMPTADLAVAWLVAVNFFAALPWGAANAAAAEVVPSRLRAQGVAMYFLVMSLVSRTLGPVAVGMLTDSVFHDETAIGYSLVIVNVVGMALTIVLLGSGLSAYRRTVETVGAPPSA